MSKLGDHLTYANVVATIAAVAAIAGGTAIADGAGKRADTTVRTAQSAATTDADGSSNGGQVATAVAKAKCRKGELLVGGGAKWIIDDDDKSKNVSLRDSFAKGRTWVAEGTIDFGAQGNARIQAQAICLKL
ncbi:hypothetical protein HJD18_11955 [Thermoleophilia bacterium SCSIO 60948]|nr:hypothetical protein HJD18_11955 [Thermoleophilia bacterium SCSIO 60948]